MGFKPLENLNLPVIHLSGESDAEMRKIVKEIDIAIRQRVSSIGVQQKLTDDEQGILVTRLLCVRNRTYLWAHLTLDLIQRQLDINKEKIIDITSHLPHNVNEAYERILCRTFSTEKATRMLHLILAAKRPLTLGEMIVALELQQHHRSIDDIELEPEDRFRDKIRDICGLVTVNESRIFLLHQTVKEFLISMDHSEPASPSSLSWKHSILANDPNMTLTSVCVWCLLLNHPRKDQYTAVPPPSTHTKKNAFISYAAKHWANHFNRLSAHNQKKMTSVALEICDARGSCFLSALSWAAGNGHDGVVKRLIRGLSIGPRTLKIVLRQGAKINEFDSDNRTPLTYAIWNRHLSVVRRLVEAGAWVDVPDVLGGTPTSCQYQRQDWDDTPSLRYPTARKAPINSRNSRGLTPLAQACLIMDLDIVSAFLETDLWDLNIADSYGNTPLHHAIQARSVPITSALIATGKAGVAMKNKDGRTPLSLACLDGNTGLVKYLLDNSQADINTQDIYGRTPVHNCIWMEDVDMLRLILQTGRAKLNVVDKFQCTPLLLAAYQSKWHMASLLLNYKQAVNMKGQKGRTVIFWAIIQGQTEIVRQLISLEQTNLAVRDEEGFTPLSHAAQQGNEEIIRVLLGKPGIDVDAKDNAGMTALGHAAKQGHLGAVELLLNEGKANSWIKDKEGRTPLALASAEGHFKVVQRILF
ncbi:Ankyrin repeat domain-containing protein 50 [Fusarium odoratissimum]|uniref:Ankyrin repeat domain-containing protein 50 n=1 Tax=Fusarium oxysporum f. sp. cubense (strain race 4) TaxID=2502994 RepID=N1SBE9_FUSC4|nr:Ankyrin repeat domain-containing protein 50 [Fusarium odoratissimum]